MALACPVASMPASQNARLHPTPVLWAALPINTLLPGSVRTGLGAASAGCSIGKDLSCRLFAGEKLAYGEI